MVPVRVGVMPICVISGHFTRLVFCLGEIVL